MLPFFSTFISGLGELVGRWLQEDLLNVKIDALSDGLVIFETGTSSHDVGKIRYLNNCFVLISKYGSTQLITDVSAAVGFLLRDKGIGGKLRQLGAIKGGSFKVIFSSENRTVPVDRSLLSRLERLINGVTRLRPVGFGASLDLNLPIFFVVSLIRVKAMLFSTPFVGQAPFFSRELVLFPTKWPSSSITMWRR